MEVGLFWRAISVCPHLKWENGMVLPSSLQKLHLWDCGNFSLRYLENLTSLQSLQMDTCKHRVHSMRSVELSQITPVIMYYELWKPCINWCTRRDCTRTKGAHCKLPKVEGSTTAAVERLFWWWLRCHKLLSDKSQWSECRGPNYIYVWSGVSRVKSGRPAVGRRRPAMEHGGCLVAVVSCKSVEFNLPCPLLVQATNLDPVKIHLPWQLLLLNFSLYLGVWIHSKKNG